MLHVTRFGSLVATCGKGSIVGSLPSETVGSLQSFLFQVASAATSSTAQLCRLSKRGSSEARLFLSHMDAMEILVEEDCKRIEHIYTEQLFRYFYNEAAIGSDSEVILITSARLLRCEVAVSFVEAHKSPHTLLFCGLNPRVPRQLLRAALLRVCSKQRLSLHTS